MPRPRILILVLAASLVLAACRVDTTLVVRMQSSGAGEVAVRVHLDRAALAPGARVLDIGCGDGGLIDHLYRTKGCDARGIEIDMAEVTRAVAHGLPVMHGDADHDLAQYPDGAFDYVVLSRTLQAVERPREVLRQMLRIGKHALVSFPNFGHWKLRWQLLWTGRMPMTSVWGRPWHETPNIHHTTLKDFRDFVVANGGSIVQEVPLHAADGRVAREARMLPNLTADTAVMMRKPRMIWRWGDMRPASRPLNAAPAMMPPMLQMKNQKNCVGLSCRCSPSHTGAARRPPPAPPCR